MLIKKISVFLRDKIFNFKDIFSLLVLILLGLETLSLVLALLGWHYAIIMKIAVLLGLLFFCSFLFLNLKNIKISFSWSKTLFIFILIIFLGVMFFYSEPTIFSGRDQGSLSEAAIMLSENHSLFENSLVGDTFFEIYGKGKALNFPGFFYTENGELVTQFPLGYISFLAIFYAIFGLIGLKIANIVLGGLCIGIFYFISEKILAPKNSFLPPLLMLSSFVFSWFLKFTLGENLALMLLWLAIWKMMEWWENPDKNKILLVVMSLGLLAFVRDEGLILALIAFGIVLLKKKKNNYKSVASKFIKILIGLFGLLFVFSVFINQEFYKVIIKSFLPSGASDTVGGSTFFQEIFHTYNVLSIYAIVIFLAFAFLGVVILIKKRDVKKLLPLIIISPTLIFLLDPGISNDHPWMLRRFYYSVIPASYLFSIFFLENFFKKKKIFTFFVSLLVIYNLMVSLVYFSFVPQGGLLNQTREISKNFSDDDLILVDRLATGDPFAMIAGPLRAVFNKNAVYFFNLEDLKKINLTEFNKVFFIVPDDNTDFYFENDTLRGKIIPQKEYCFDREMLVNEETELQLNLPVRGEVQVCGKIYEYKY